MFVKFKRERLDTTPPLDVKPKKRASKAKFPVATRTRPPLKPKVPPSAPNYEIPDKVAKHVWYSAPRFNDLDKSGCRVYDNARCGELLLASEDPEPEKCCRTAEVLMSLLEGTKMKFAFIGGFALYLMGNDRLPKDVDVAIYDHSIDQVICRLSKSELACIPEVRREGFRTTVFMSSDPWKYPPPVVRVDFIVAGCLSVPTFLPLFTDYIEPKLEWRSENKPIPVVTPYFLFNAKLHAHHDRRQYTDTDFNDLQWLLDNYEHLIHRNTWFYYIKHRMTFYESADAFSEEFGNLVMRVMRLKDELTAPADSTAEEMAAIVRLRQLLEMNDALMGCNRSWR